MKKKFSSYFEANPWEKAPKPAEDCKPKWRTDYSRPNKIRETFDGSWASTGENPNVSAWDRNITPNPCGEIPLGTHDVIMAEESKPSTINAIYTENAKLKLRVKDLEDSLNELRSYTIQEAAIATNVNAQEMVSFWDAVDEHIGATLDDEVEK